MGSGEKDGTVVVFVEAIVKNTGSPVAGLIQ